MREAGRDSTADRGRRVEESDGVSGRARARRRWSAEDKARVVRESFRPGKLVGEVAHRYGVSRWQLSARRSLARAGKLAVPGLGQPEPVDVAPEGDLTRVLVQFPSLETISRLQSEADRYRTEAAERLEIPVGPRTKFFDGLHRVDTVSRADRIGNRLASEGYPDAETFAVDVDLWHPGTRDGAREVQEQLRDLPGARARVPRRSPSASPACVA